MQKPLRVALYAIVVALGCACFTSIFFEDKPWFPWPGRGDALSICGWALFAISVSLAPRPLPSSLRVARFICKGLACGALGVGVAALFTALPEAVMHWSDISANFIFVAALVIDGLASHLAKKKKETPQENPP
ncbi:MAG: hypothetical protein LBB75_00300 [Oscillospiraceae bacterium]|jgi:hypothetical protein|nr:hypothetical protein [Oscillospiraceae bacterium]